MKKFVTFLSLSLIAILLCSIQTKGQVDLALANGIMNYHPATHEIAVTIDVKNLGSSDLGFGTSAKVGCYRYCGG